MTDTNADQNQLDGEQIKERIADDMGGRRDMITTVLLYAGVLAFGFMLGTHYMAANLRPFLLAGNSLLSGSTPTVQAITAFGNTYTSMSDALPDLYYFGMKIGGAVALIGLGLGTYLSVRWE